MHFCFLVEVLLLLIIFLVSCAAAAGGACAAYNISTVLKQRKVPVTVSSYVSVVYTAMLRTSIAAVVLGCVYFCPLDCDASGMVVDCAAVETGCMLEKFIKVATKYVFIFIFWSRCCCCCCCCVLLLLPTTSVLRRREAAAELQRPRRTVHVVLDFSIAKHA